MISADHRRAARRSAAVAMVLVAATSLAACATPAGTGATGGTNEVKLGLVYWQSNVNAFQEMAYGGLFAADTTDGVSVTSAAPATEDPAKQLQQFQSTAQVAKDGIVLQTLRGDMMLRPVQEAVAKGIPVIAIDAPLPEGSGADLFVTNDNFALGGDLATALLENVPEGPGEVVIGTNGPAVPPLMGRVDGMIAKISELRPDLTIVGPITTGGTTTDNLASWSSILLANPDAVAYMAPSNQDAASIAVLSKQSGTKYNAGGCDLEQSALQGVKDGYITALASPEHWLKGYVAMSILADHAQNGTAIPKGVWDTGGLIVDSSNVDEIIERQQSEEKRSAWFKDSAAEQVANPDKYLAAP